MSARSPFGGSGKENNLSGGGDCPGESPFFYEVSPSSGWWCVTNKGGAAPP